MAMQIKRFLTQRCIRNYIVIMTPLTFITIFFLLKRKGKRKGERDYKDENYRNAIIKIIPFRILSRLFGRISDANFPVFIRAPFFHLFCLIYGVDKRELPQSVSSFRTFKELFTRSVDTDKFRSVSDSVLVSPVDGLIVSLGKTDNNDLFDAKGVKIPLKQMLGKEVPTEHDLYFVNYYLAVGMYHHFHSPADWSIERMRHFVGDLIPVNAVFSRLMPGLFVNNERVVLEGTWEHGYFSFTPIGALNVGSIRLSPLVDAELRTNVSNEQVSREIDFRLSGEKAVSFKRREELGYFETGSSVVVVFSVPKDAEFKFCVRKGDYIKMGEGVGEIARH